MLFITSCRRCFSTSEPSWNVRLPTWMARRTAARVTNLEKYSWSSGSCGVHKDYCGLFRRNNLHVYLHVCIIRKGFALRSQTPADIRSASVSEYLTCHVVEVVTAACSILEERGVWIHVTIQQAIKNLRTHVSIPVVLFDFIHKINACFIIKTGSMTCIPWAIRNYILY